MENDCPRCRYANFFFFRREAKASFKIRKIARLRSHLRFRSHNNNNNNNNRLPSKISGWVANPGGKRLKPIEEISQEELNACLYVSTHLRGLQLQKFIYEIRTSGGHNVRFRRSAPLSKTFAQMCTALTLLDNLEV